MQSVSVYIWKPRSGYVGHTSLSVNLFDAPVRYLSFWPDGGTKGKGAKATDLLTRRSVPGALMKNYAADETAEDLEAHETVKLNNAAMPELNAYISELQGNIPRYTFFRVNCSYIVAKALYRATGIKHNFSLHAYYQTPKTGLGALYRGVWTPMMVLKYARQLEQAEADADADADADAA